jgi:transcriptional regulator with GAF, ATPase, and Fis domain
MHNSEDVENVLKAMWDGLGALDVPVMFCSVNLIDDETDPPLVTVYSLNQEGRWRQREFRVEKDGPILRIWKRRKLAYRADLQEDDPYGEWDGFGEIAVRAVVDAPFAQGTLAISSKTPNVFSPQDLDILQEMAQIISRGFQRLQDLQTLERRNQKLESEASQREEREKERAALHLVRQKVWEMKGENDIEKVMAAVEDGLILLDVPFREYGINIVDQDATSAKVRINTKTRGQRARIWTDAPNPMTYDFIISLRVCG